MIAIGEELGGYLGQRAVRALGIEPGQAESYGKAVIVGEAGELEHAEAILHPRLGAPLRQAVEKGAALVPSAKKQGGAGSTIDVPLGHKDAAYVRSHFDARRLYEQSNRSVEIVYNGNEKAALFAMRTTMELGQPERIILGTDSPAGSGVQPLGILRLMSMLSSIGEVDPELVFCFATGNTARQRRLDNGLIEVGHAADFVIMDRAQHSAGSDFLDCIRKRDGPEISMLIIDGLVRSRQSRNTPPADRFATVED